MPSEERVKQLVLEALSGRLPPAVPETRLPDEKSGFPKVLALDCNQWVALGRVHYGKSTDAGAVRALDEIRSAIAGGRLLVPLHFINSIEAMQREDPGSRERLVRFMVEVSGNWFFRPFFEVAEAETRVAIREVRSIPTHAAPTVRPTLVAYGTAAMFGPHSSETESALAALDEYGLREVMDRWHRSPEATIEQLVHALRGDSTTASSRALEERGASRMQDARDADSTLSPHDRIRLELTNQWNGRPGEYVRRVLSEAGLDAEAFREWLAEGDNLEHFWERIPSVHVPLMLEIESAKNRSREVAANDLRDMSFYETVLPYANIVVTEKYWADRIQRAKLGARYGTHVHRRLADLHEALGTEGCA